MSMTKIIEMYAIFQHLLDQFELVGIKNSVAAVEKPNWVASPTTVTGFGILLSVLIRQSLQLDNYTAKGNAFKKAFLIMYIVVRNIIKNNLSLKRYAYFTILFFLFIFIFTSNIMGLILYSFTLTNSFIITLYLASSQFIGINIIASHLIVPFLPVRKYSSNNLEKKKDKGILTPQEEEMYKNAPSLRESVIKQRKKTFSYKLEQEYLQSMEWLLQSSIKRVVKKGLKGAYFVLILLLVLFLILLLDGVIVLKFGKNFLTSPVTFVWVLIYLLSFIMYVSYTRIEKETKNIRQKHQIATTKMCISILFIIIIFFKAIVIFPTFIAILLQLECCKNWHSLFSCNLGIMLYKQYICDVVYISLKITVHEDILKMYVNKYNGLEKLIASNWESYSVNIIFESEDAFKTAKALYEDKMWNRWYKFLDISSRRNDYWEFVYTNYAFNKASSIVNDDFNQLFNKIWYNNRS